MAHRFMLKKSLLEVGKRQGNSAGRYNYRATLESMRKWTHGRRKTTKSSAGTLLQKPDTSNGWRTPKNPNNSKVARTEQRTNKRNEQAVN